MCENTTGKASHLALKVLALTTLVVAVALGCWVWFSGDQCSMPARREIVGIRVNNEFWAFQGDRKIPAFEIPEKHWDAVLAALSPSRPDPAPAAWVHLCGLDVRTRANRNYAVDVYWLQHDDEPEEPGAFGISVDGKRMYFRGGKSVQLRDAIAAAYDQSKSPAP